MQMGSVSVSNAQDRNFRITIGAGLSTSFGFSDVRRPGFSGRLWVEKLIDKDEAKAMWFALEHTYMLAAGSKTELLDPTGTTTITYTYRPSHVTTLTFGGRKWMDNNIVWGIGSGFGIYSQGYPHFTYSEDILNYLQYQKSVSGWGLAAAGHIGYKPGNFQATFNLQGVMDVFRTVDLSNQYDRARSSSVITLGLSLGYTF
jgi:hypothetical protein